MQKYLFYGSYTPEGYKGLLSEGGSVRKEMDEAVKMRVDFRLPGH
jgi:hypothetical protein